ncbi:MAG: iron-containing alcohol dehydrogenase [Pseudomonadota bacterium]
MSSSVTWSFPTQIRFGAGRISELPNACARAGITRPLLVTDASLASLPITSQAMDLLRAHDLDPGLFAEVQPNPTDRNLRAGIEDFKAGGYNGVVAFGGGSAIDLGKLIAFQSHQVKSVWDFEDGGNRWKAANHEAIAPIIAVPTTAGTGSEVGRASVLTDTEQHVKKIIFHPKILPSIVIADPELTIGLPPEITVGTGMDALAHCLEAYYAPGFHPMAEGIALEGVRLVKENLPRVFNNPKDLESRSAMLSAAMIGAVAFQKGLGGIHALSHPIGALYNSHHGMTNAVLMPYVLAANRPAIEDKTARLAAFLGLEGGFSSVMDWVLALRKDLNVPHTLEAFGIDNARFDELTKMAVVDPTASGNPLPLTERVVEALYRAAFKG